jgi:hypothetical protein
MFLVLNPDSLLGRWIGRPLVVRDWMMSSKGTEQITMGTQIACSHPSRSATMSVQKPAMNREEMHTCDQSVSQSIS